MSMVLKPGVQTSVSGSTTEVPTTGQQQETWGKAEVERWQGGSFLELTVMPVTGRVTDRVTGSH